MKRVVVAGLSAGLATVGGVAVAQQPGTVHTSAELVKALAAAAPGDTITLAAGKYTGAFFGTAKGTADRPITLTGPRDAVLSNSSGGCAPPTGGNKNCGYGFHLGGAAYWKLSGFAVSDSAKGIVLDGSSHVTIDNVEVSGIGAEGVHFRSGSSDNVISHSSIHDTGTAQPEYGEGLYFGSAKSNWPKYGSPDRSDRNQALDNTIGPNVRAEGVDIKEGTVDGVLRGNTFNGHGIAGRNAADSWVDVKGNGYRIESNHGVFDGSGALVDGYQVHRVVDGDGCGNSFHTNDSDLGSADGYAIDVTDQKKCDDPNTVSKDNTVKGGKGLTNITPAVQAGSIR